MSGDQVIKILQTKCTTGHSQVTSTFRRLTTVVQEILQVFILHTGRASPQLAQMKKPLTHLDCWMFRDVEAPQWEAKHCHFCTACMCSGMPSPYAVSYYPVFNNGFQHTTTAIIWHMDSTIKCSAAITAVFFFIYSIAHHTTISMQDVISKKNMKHALKQSWCYSAAHICLSKLF